MRATIARARLMAVVSVQTSEGERLLGRGENDVGTGLDTGLDTGLGPAMRSLSRAGGADAAARAVVRACPQA